MPDELISADAVSQILGWIARPDPAAWRSLASVLPLAFFNQNQQIWDRERLPDVALAVLTDETLPPRDPGGLPSWW